jgi:ectoine hydroxylase-related dioxygenase (phytanoyl-CoA dioxygenase family)
MPYPVASEEQIEFFNEHGYIVVKDAVDVNDLETLVEKCNYIIEHKDEVAFDWAWDAKTDRDKREFRILQSSPTRIWPEFNDAIFRKWAVEFGSALLGKRVEFWYDQFLGKPPGTSVPTYWHQDEGYWGRNLWDKGITCWMPLHDVDAKNGCMHFIDGGHKGPVLEHKQPEGVQSDLLFCEPDESRMVVCPISFGDVTFHHGRTPHMTTANTSDTYRLALTQHMQTPDAGGEGDHYPWKVYVNQFTGERFVPPSR